MNQRKSVFFAVILCSAFSISVADVILDHFNDLFTSAPSQSHLGEAYGYSITKTWGDVDTGNGWWSPFADELGTKVTNGKQEALTESNMATMVENGAMHLYYKTHMSTADFIKDWPFAGIYCDLMKDTLSYFDFSNLTEVSLKLKGRGKIRVLFETKDIYEMTDATGARVGWGYYGFDITMDSTFSDWKEVKIPSALLDPEKYSPAADSLWTWDHGKAATKGFSIQAIPDEDINTKDSVDLWVDNIYLIGLDYKATFGFDYDSNVAIINIPQNKVNANIKIIPEQHTNNLSIRYDLDKNCDVYIAVYDVKGQIISELVHAKQEKGPKLIHADFNQRELTSGVYFIAFKLGSFSTTRKINVIK